MLTKTFRSPRARRLERHLRGVLADAGLSGEWAEVLTAGLLQRLALTTAESAPRGDLGRLDDDEIAACLGWPLDAELLVATLVDTGWLVRSEADRLVVAEWHDEAPNYVKGNVLKGWSPGQPSPWATGHVPEPKDAAGGPKARGAGPKAGGAGPKDDTSASASASASTPPIGGGSNSTSTMDGGDGDESTAPPPLPAAIAAPDRAAVMKFGRKIAEPKSRADVELAWGLTALAPVLSEAWLAGIAEAVLRTAPRNPWGYARRVAAEGTRERPGPGADRLRRLLALVPLPPADWPPPKTKPDQRLGESRDKEFAIT